MNLRTVIMTADCKGCPDGVNVRPYYSGEEYNLPESLGRAFVEGLKVAEDVVVLTAEEIEAAAKELAELVAKEEAEAAAKEEAEAAAKEAAITPPKAPAPKAPSKPKAK